MDQAVSTLGVVTNGYRVEDTERVGIFRRRSVERVINYLDWTVDGRPLRDLLLYANGDTPEEVTPVQNDWATRSLRLEMFRALLSGTTPSRSDTAMPDGRVALLFCGYCFDLGCATLTTKLRLTDEQVQWRDIGWQVAYDTLELAESDFVPPTLTFNRTQYETLLKGLRDLELADR